MSAKAETASPSPAAAAMDRMYRWQRHVYDATRKYYLLGRDRLIDELKPQPGHRVLEIGCGTGRNLICAARRYPLAQFHGIDISAEMLVSAERAIARAGLSPRVSVAQGDACDSATWERWGEARFDRVFISYSLSMIPDWRQALACAASRLEPDGELHLVDFGGQEGLPSWFRSALRRWLALFHVIPRDALEDELEKLKPGRLRFSRPLRGYAQHAVLVAPKR